MVSKAIAKANHRLVITRSRLTKPHDPAVSHEPPYMCAEATLIAFVIAQRPHAEDGARFEPLVMRAHLALPHPRKLSYHFMFRFSILTVTTTGAEMLDQTGQ